MRRAVALGMSAAALILPVPTYAQSNSAIEDADDYLELDDHTIVVLGRSSRGAIVGESAVEVELDENAVASYGASDIEELIAQLAPLTRSARGQGGGAPVLLLNGRRIADRREMYRLPPEAIERVQILPEEVALRYGYAADQRVMNFILKKNFSAFTGEVEHGRSRSGDRGETELEANYLKLTERGRISLEAEYNHATRVLESDRNIHYANGSPDEGRNRTLLPETHGIDLNALVSRSFSDTTALTLNATHERSDAAARVGIDALSGRLREQDSHNRTTHVSTTLDGVTMGWQWTVTANADWRRDRTVLAERGGAVIDTALSRQRTLDADVNVNGTLFALPAGEVLLGLRGGVSDVALRSVRQRAAGITRGSLGRTETLARANLDVPLVEGGRGALGMLGDIAANLNGSIRDLSDFGAIRSYGYGVTWKPSGNLSVLFSMAHEKDPPLVGQLGAPLVTTPGVSVYDFVRDTTVPVDVITGGNPALSAENRADWKISTSWDAPFVDDLTLLAEYYNNNNKGRLASFPLLTPDIEAAFPDRVVRDASGNLVSVHRRTINYTNSANQVVRYGFSYSRTFGGSNEGESSPGQNAAPRFGRGGARGDGGRWNVDLFHSIRLQDEITVRPGLKLDLLDGDAIADTGGPGRHLVELDGGWSLGGLGIRASAKYQSGSRVDGGGIGSNLYFSDLLTVDLRAFFNFDRNRQLVERHPWLEGLRLRLKIENLTNAVQTVRDANGVVPLSYQPGYLDPRGRFIEISLRKQL